MAQSVLQVEKSLAWAQKQGRNAFLVVPLSGIRPAGSEGIQGHRAIGWREK